MRGMPRSIQELAAAINQRYVEYIDGKRKLSPVTSNRASALGHPCDYHAYLNRVAWQKTDPPDIGLQGIFERGNEMEPIIREIMRRIGFLCTSEQRPMRWDHYQITGHIDGAIADRETWGEVISEFKSTANPQLASVRTADELIRIPMGARWYSQMQVYLIGNNTEQGVLIILDVITWKLTAIPIVLDWDYATRMTERAERVNTAVELYQDLVKEARGPLEMPKAADLDLSVANDIRVCKRCPHYGRTCFPDIDLSAGTTVLADPELESMLRRHEELDAGAKEHKKLSEELKARLKTRGENVIVGPFLVRNKLINTTKFNIPAEVKAQYREPSSFIRCTWTKPSGAEDDQPVEMPVTHDSKLEME